MKYSKLGLLLLAAALVCGTLFPRTAKADPEVSFDFFYDSLDPYGDWIELPDYGYCWRPSNVDEDWAPYTDGYWANTDAGWTWVSYEDWGGITYHYGRWARVPGEGWVWVPDYDWAPAWVSWRSSDDFVGWAPLPPAARWEPTIGFSFWVDSYCDIGPTYYNFCETRNFGSPALRAVIINRSRNVTIINHTTNITNITVNKTTNIVYNGGPSYAVISQKSLRPIQTLKLRQQTDMGDWRKNRGGTMARQRGNELLVIAPRVAASSGKSKPSRVARVLPKATIDTGWAGVSDPKVRNDLHAKFKQESRNVTPAQAPALPPTERQISSFEQRLKSAPQASTGARNQEGSGVNPARTNRQAPVSVENPAASVPTPPTGNVQRGKHGETIRPFIQPNPAQETAVPAVQPQRQSRAEESMPPSQVPPRSNNEQNLQRQQQNDSSAQQASEQRRQRALEEQSRVQEQNQRKQQNVQEQQQRAQEAQQQHQQQQQAIQEQQQRQQQQLQRAQEQQQRAQEQGARREKESQAAQERQAEKAQRVQESQQRRAEQPARQEKQERQVERAPQVQQPSSAPQRPSEGEGKKHGKDKDKDKDQDR